MPDFDELIKPFLKLSPDEQFKLIMTCRNNRLNSKVSGKGKKKKTKSGKTKEQKALELLGALSDEDKKALLAELSIEVE